MSCFSTHSIRGFLKGLVPSSNTPIILPIILPYNAVIDHDFPTMGHSGIMIVSGSVICISGEAYF